MGFFQESYKNFGKEGYRSAKNKVFEFFDPVDEIATLLLYATFCTHNPKL